MTSPITASMLYDLVTCPHRVPMDLFGNPAERDEVSPFVQLLWERGAAHEKATIEALNVPFVDLSPYSLEDKERRTIEAMGAGAPLIYGGRIRADGLLGDPDLLRREGDGYVAGDIKSGAGEESGEDEDDGKPKKTYGVQLTLYTDVLERLGLSAARRGFIWDVRGAEVAYDLTTALTSKDRRRASPPRHAPSPDRQKSGGIALVVGFSSTVGLSFFQASTVACLIASSVSTRAASQP